MNKHLSDWLEREFGKKQVKKLLEIKNEYYRLAYIRKPEHMGNTRTEEKDPIHNTLKDMPWTEEEVQTRLQEYSTLEKKIDLLSGKIPTDKRDSWFQLVEYPVKGAAEMNKKHLFAQWPVRKFLLMFSKTTKCLKEYRVCSSEMRLATL